MQQLIADPSFRRWSVTILAMFMPVLNSKFGLNMTPEDLLHVIELAGGYVVMSNAKAMNDARVSVGKAATDAIKTGEDADAALRKGPPQALLIILAIAIAAMPMRAQAQDVPLRDEVVDFAPIKKGEPSPVDGRVYTTDYHIKNTQRVVGCEAREKTCVDQQQTLRTIAVVAPIVTVVLGLAAGFAVGYAVRAPAPQNP